MTNKKKDAFKIQHTYRQRFKKKYRENGSKYEVLIIALIFLAIIIVKWLD